MGDYVLYVGFPYVAIALAVGVGAYRYFTSEFTYSSLSSQMLEGRILFWGVVPWHYGIVVVLLAHLLALIFRGSWAALVIGPLRLYAFEISGWALALLALFGLGVLIIRRATSHQLRIVTSGMDWVLLVALFATVLLGFWTAFVYRWGSAWGTYTLVPWVASLISLSPRIDVVRDLPLVVRLHVLLGFLIIALFPFTRLVHFVTYPIAYFWRAYQQVIWTRRRRDARPPR